jgi:hypothetical protein
MIMIMMFTGKTGLYTPPFGEKKRNDGINNCETERAGQVLKPKL